MTAQDGSLSFGKRVILWYNQDMDEKDTGKHKWGGTRKGAGRPKIHADETPVRTLWLRATDEEWSRFMAFLPADSRERFIFLSNLLVEKDG